MMKIRGSAPRECVMPLYEYECRHCGRRFEVLQRMGDGPEGLACPACDSADVEREASTFAGMGASSASGASGCAPSRGFS